MTFKTVYNAYKNADLANGFCEILNQKQSIQIYLDMRWDFISKIF